MPWHPRRSSDTSKQSEWLDQLLADLARSGPAGETTARFLEERGITVSTHEQPTGARWTLGGRIQIHPRFAHDPAAAPYALSLIVHEARHLRQGLLTALSVYGELDAWMLQFSFLKAMVGRYHELPEKDQVIEELVSLPLGWDRSVLMHARRLMQAYAGKKYRIDLLPLFPMHRELLFGLTQREPTAS